MRLGFVIIVLLLVSGVAQAKDPLEEKASQVGRTDSTGLIHVANLFLEAERIKEAKKYFKEAAVRLSNKSEAQLGLAQVRMINGNLHQAKQGCRKLKEEFPKSPVSRICYGRMWLKFGRSARAIDEFQSVVDEGSDVRGKTGLAKTYALMNDYKKAVALYREAIEEGAGYQARLGLGLALERQGDKKGALSELKAAVDTEALSALSQYHYGRLMKKGESGIGHLEKAIALRPGWSDALGTLGEKYLLVGNGAKAAEAYRKALVVEPDRGAFRLGLGKALYLQKKYKEARKALDKALEVVPNYVGATLMLADVELAVGDKFKAAELAERAVALSPNSAEVCRDVAKLFFRMERFTKANAYFMKASSLDPKDSEPLVYLGDVACERRMYKEGIDYYSRALKGNMEAFSKKEIQSRIKKCR